MFMLSGLVFLNSPVFGALPKGERLKRIRQSPNYRDGKFRNLTETPMMTKDASMVKIMFNFLLGDKNVLPKKPIPAIKSNLKTSSDNKAVLTWFGHSSYLLQINNFNIIVDPVFSTKTSPVQWAGTEAFPGTDTYSVEDLPKIDVVLITHDHYDHLDYPTIKKLGNSVGKYITTLGVGAHLEKWGIDKDKILENDWWDEINISTDIKLIAAPARHFSGRNITGRNQSLWASFILLSDNYKIYLGGDSGYEDHFKTIGEKHGPFDLAILECGQYNKYWPYIHMFPEETAQAAIDLQAKVLFPVHWAKFKLSTHHWSESVKRVLAKAAVLKLPVTTPQIGEPIIVNEQYPQKNWWEGI
ncbi:MAG: MBL fold metallo-hydrolase [Bacteroidia bacterium]